MLDRLEGRNGTREFAARSITNLDFLLASADAGAKVHPITQTVSTLLAIIVFPWERSAFDAVKNKRLTLAASEGWPKWRMGGSLDESGAVRTVGDLLKQLRHAVAHGNVRFDSDSRELSDVSITFESFDGRSKQLKWRGTIQANQLAEFCRKFSKFVEDRVA